MIPPEELEARTTADRFNRIITSVIEARMNTLRIWGGGIFYYEHFYNLCDKHGLLLYHDMQYTNWLIDHTPSPTQTQYDELSHQLQRLSHHPSIVIYDSCNECQGGDLYLSFVSPTIAQHDPSKVIWPSCPSQGWRSGVSRLWGLPNGEQLSVIPGSYNAGPTEFHGIVNYFKQI